MYTHNFSSSVQLSISLVPCTHKGGIELNRQIPYLQATLYYSLGIILCPTLRAMFMTTCAINPPQYLLLEIFLSNAIAFYVIRGKSKILAAFNYKVC